MEDLEDDLFTLSPLSSPGSTPDTTPRAGVIELPSLDFELAGEEGRGLADGSSAAVCSRKKRRSMRSKEFSKGRKRQKLEEQQKRTFGPEVREKARMKYAVGGRVFWATGSASDSKVSRGGYSGRKVVPRLEKRTLEALKEKGYTLLGWDGR